MDGIKVLISPLSWGYGHTGRMIPLARELQKRGCEVWFAADADMLIMAGRELPGAGMIEIPGLRIRYSRSLPQYLSVFLQLPRIIASAIRDHRTLKHLAEQIMPAVIVSDNRFGFYHNDIFSVYVTHQLRIPFPALLRFMEPLAQMIHRVIINKYDLCLVPDYPGSPNLSGRLSHPSGIPGYISPSGINGQSQKGGQSQGASLPLKSSILRQTGLQGEYLSSRSVRPALNPVYTGPLSRFAFPDALPANRPLSISSPYFCLVMSGPEPQRTMLLEKVVTALDHPNNEAGTSSTDKGQTAAESGLLPPLHLVILAAGPVSQVTASSVKTEYIISASTHVMRQVIAGASLVITRAGYTSIMELVSLGKGAVLIPTPGQTEQEYLGNHLHGRYGFVTMDQDRLEQLSSIAFSLQHNGESEGINAENQPYLPDPAPILENAIDLLLERVMRSKIVGDFLRIED